VFREPHNQPSGYIKAGIFLNTFTTVRLSTRPWKVELLEILSEVLYGNGRVHLDAVSHLVKDTFR
jgi:hypothetical protein